MNSARSTVDYRNAAAQFNKISGFKDADSLSQLCLAKANEIEEKEKAESDRQSGTESPCHGSPGNADESHGVQ